MHVQIQLCRNWWINFLCKKKAFLNRRLAQKYKLAYHDCDTNGNIRIVTLMNLLQDVTQKHTSKLGYGKEFLLLNRGWVVTKYAIKIKKYPRAKDKITVLTWVSKTSKTMLLRQFMVVNAKGVVLIEAVSKWGLIDLVKKKPLTLPPFFLCKKELFPTTFLQPQPKDAETITRTFPVLYDNIDFNGHVNNALYPFWATECVSPEFRKENMPCELLISFKKEALYGNEIIVSTQTEGLKTVSSLDSADQTNYAKVTIWWRKS